MSEYFACAESTSITGSTPIGGPASRCDDCGHLVINHPLGARYCELCVIEQRLHELEGRKL